MLRYIFGRKIVQPSDAFKEPKENQPSVQVKCIKQIHKPHPTITLITNVQCCYCLKEHTHSSNIIIINNADMEDSDAFIHALPNCFGFHKADCLSPDSPHGYNILATDWKAFHILE